LGVELFGNDNNGLLEHARGGTLVLDEAHAMSAALYSRLTSTLATPGLRAGVDARTMDVRLVLTVRTTPADSPGAMAPFVDERAMLRIPVPALRERRRDIPLLVQHFRDRLTHEGGLAPITGDAMTPLLAHDWPGNVRELSHWVDRTALAADGAHSVPSHFALASAPEFAPLDAAGLTLAALEQRYILHVLAQERGHQSRAADRLGIDRRTLYRKLKGYRDEGIARIAG
jgi:DNA-binding NtrC family response regulator